MSCYDSDCLEVQLPKVGVKAFILSCTDVWIGCRTKPHAVAKIDLACHAVV